MKHKCKEFWDMINIAKRFGCIITTTRQGFKIIPPDKNFPMYTCHESDRGIHPLRRYLKNTCKFEVI